VRSASDRALRDALHHFRLLLEHAAGGLDRQTAADEIPIIVGAIEGALRA